MKSYTLLSIALLLAAFLTAGCETTKKDFETAKPSEPPPPGLNLGETLEIEFPDRPDGDPSGKLIKTKVKDDGTISLPLLKEPIKAVGLTDRELEKAIHDKYVPEYYHRLTVLVRPTDRFYFVGGQVKQPNRQLYLGEMTVTKAIQSAGDFTDFANRRNVKLIRANRKVIIVDCIKASTDPKLDPPVFSGDRIEVPMKWY
ncbi:MAG: SLBB domain-containing protein [Opitutaceae bacterium]|nr:SLBB domain-containing protein [Verrucomicrobiales bacterium]